MEESTDESVSVLVTCLYERALTQLEKTRKRSFVTAAKRVRESVTKDLQKILLDCEFRKKAGRLASHDPLRDDIEAYNEVAIRVFQTRWSIKHKETLIQCAKDFVKSGQLVVCGYCGRVLATPEARDGYCSKKCQKGKWNQQGWLRRSAMSASTLTGKSPSAS